MLKPNEIFTGALLISLFLFLNTFFFMLLNTRWLSNDNLFGSQGGDHFLSVGRQSKNVVAMATTATT